MEVFMTDKEKENIKQWAEAMTAEEQQIVVTCLSNEAIVSELTRRLANFDCICGHLKGLSNHISEELHHIK
jgi:hypothetical protein